MDVNTNLGDDIYKELEEIDNITRLLEEKRQNISSKNIKSLENIFDEENNPLTIYDEEYKTKRLRLYRDKIMYINNKGEHNITPREDGNYFIIKSKNGFELVKKENEGWAGISLDEYISGKENWNKIDDIQDGKIILGINKEGNEIIYTIPNDIKIKKNKKKNTNNYQNNKTNPQSDRNSKGIRKNINNPYNGRDKVMTMNNQGGKNIGGDNYHLNQNGKDTQTSNNGSDLEGVINNGKGGSNPNYQINIKPGDVYDKIIREIEGDWGRIINEAKRPTDKVALMGRYFYEMKKRDEQQYQKIKEKIEYGGALNAVVTSLEKIVNVNAFLQYFKEKYKDGLGEDKSNKLKEILERHIKREGLEDPLEESILRNYIRVLPRIKNGEKIVNDAYKEFKVISFEEYIDSMEKGRPGYIVRAARGP